MKRITTHLWRRAARGRRGSALPYMTIVIFALMTVTLAFQVTTLASKRRVESARHEIRAQNLLDAAVAESMKAISMGGTGNVGKPNQPAYLDGGLFWVQSIPLINDRFQLDAIAMAGSGRAAARVVVEKELKDPLFQSVLNSDEQLTMNSAVMVDSYDSFVGTYNSQMTNTFTNPVTGQVHNYASTNGDVTSNEGIVLNSDATVFGDAIPGPGYGVSFATGSYVSGSTTSGPNPFLFPPISVPPFPVTGSISVGPNTNSTLASGQYGLTSLAIGKSGTLTVQGPAEIVVGDFNGGKDGRLMIDATNGPVTFYVTNSYTHNLGFEADAVTGSPMAMAMMITATQDIVFPSNTKVRGAYYAPNSRITFTSGNEAWGAFGAKRIDMSANMRFHFDEELIKHWQGGNNKGGDQVEVLAWAPAEVTGNFARDRRDPFMLVGVNAAQLPTPVNAWDLP